MGSNVKLPPDAARTSGTASRVDRPGTAAQPGRANEIPERGGAGSKRSVEEEMSAFVDTSPRPTDFEPDDVEPPPVAEPPPYPPGSSARSRQLSSKSATASAAARTQARTDSRAAVPTTANAPGLPPAQAEQMRRISQIVKLLSELERQSAEHPEFAYTGRAQVAQPQTRAASASAPSPASQPAGLARASATPSEGPVAAAAPVAEPPSTQTPPAASEDPAALMAQVAQLRALAGLPPTSTSSATPAPAAATDPAKEFEALKKQLLLQGYSPAALEAAKPPSAASRIAEESSTLAREIQLGGYAGIVVGNALVKFGAARAAQKATSDAVQTSVQGTLKALDALDEAANPALVKTMKSLVTTSTKVAAKEGTKAAVATAKEAGVFGSVAKAAIVTEKQAEAITRVVTGAAERAAANASKGLIRRTLSTVGDKLLSVSGKAKAASDGVFDASEAVLSTNSFWRTTGWMQRKASSLGGLSTASGTLGKAAKFTGDEGLGVIGKLWRGIRGTGEAGATGAKAASALGPGSQLAVEAATPEAAKVATTAAKGFLQGSKLLKAVSKALPFISVGFAAADTVSAGATLAKKEATGTEKVLRVATAAASIAGAALLFFPPASALTIGALAVTSLVTSLAADSVAN